MAREFRLQLIDICAKPIDLWDPVTGEKSNVTQLVMII